MARRVLVATLGFDSRFQMKTLTQLGSGGDIKGISLVIIVRPSTGDGRAEEAERTLVKFCREILGVEVLVLKVNVLDPPAAIGSITGALRRIDPDDIVADLSGGMRLLIMETLAALLAYKRNRSNLRIVLWAEDLSGKVDLDPKIFSLPQVTESDVKILEVLVRKGSLSLKELASELSIPRSTIHDRLRKMIDKGLVSRSKVDGMVVYTITQLGLAVYRVESGG
ncbi:MAG: CRISPR-associated CARF protein Csa3 [Desulfurococcales archaeon]|nr:CRISPR-associated CARF protein Csa3 [Desulfurococcales archaeon]